MDFKKKHPFHNIFTPEVFWFWDISKFSWSWPFFSLLNTFKLWPSFILTKKINNDMNVTNYQNNKQKSQNLKNSYFRNNLPLNSFHYSHVVLSTRFSFKSLSQNKHLACFPIFTSNFSKIHIYLNQTFYSYSLNSEIYR